MEKGEEIFYCKTNGGGDDKIGSTRREEEEDEKVYEYVHVMGKEEMSRPTFANPKYLKKAQSGKPCLYKVPFDKDDLANIFAPDCAEILILGQES
ncbi:hypothetical protein Tco_1326157 [Tanacetum coccineum]